MFKLKLKNISYYCARYTNRKMGIDINLLRAEKGGDPKIVIESERLRRNKPEIVEKTIEADQNWRKAQFAYEKARAELGKNNKEIAARKKASKGQDPCEDLIAKKNEIEAGMKELQDELSQLLNYSEYKPLMKSYIKIS